MHQNNSRLSQKLDLRRHFLRRYHADGQARVFDAFQAAGVIWGKLRLEFPLASYWGVDILKKPGRLKIESSRILAQPGWRENVLDLDAYGSPWLHWLHALKNSDHSLTVFLTLGKCDNRRRTLSRLEMKILGIPFDLPQTIGAALTDFTDHWLLGQALDRFTVAEALEAFPSKNARYLGLRLEKV
jgi:hypothetical protein